MTKRELVLETLSHKKCRAIPYQIDLTGEACDAYGDRLMADYPNTQACNDFKAGLLSKSQAVSLSMGNYLLLVYPPWWAWDNLTDTFLKEEFPPDYFPDTKGYGSYESFFAQIKHIKENYDVFIVATVWEDLWEKAKVARGIENFLTDLAGSPEWAQALVDRMTEKNIVMLENFLTAPEIDGMLLGTDWGTQRDLFISPDCFRTIFKSGEKKQYELIKSYGKKVFVHSCGNILRIMEDLAELGVDCLNPVQPECMDLEFLKKEYGSRLSYYGGISTQKTLPYGTSADVRTETSRVTELMSQNGGYIISPSQHIQIDVSYENLRALIDTARDYA
ncbi:hypothetical protein FACS189447_02810 [Spirochaetia bacterium]|nr:hypothetical protein FACS189447_02810 [Spirochaetia bacterium]